ncbi:MAG: transcriptional repressor LexA [Planctomycetota bacterium]|nr:transcriptional repressor LexA [Planctomycetota bacterium]
MKHKGSAKTPELSARQAEILAFIRSTIETHGYGPTVREICQATGLKSPRSVHLHLENLQRRGHIERSKNISRSIQLPSQTVGLPLVGEVQAGRLVEAFPQNDSLDLGGLYDPDVHFVLKVRGDSMINAHIANGDYVIVRRQETCNNGDIVVALVDGETTLKRFRKTGSGIQLEPANESMEPIVVDEVTIQGVVVGVHRAMGGDG